MYGNNCLEGLKIMGNVIAFARVAQDSPIYNLRNFCREKNIGYSEDTLQTIGDRFPHNLEGNIISLTVNIQQGGGFFEKGSPFESCLSEIERFYSTRETFSIEERDYIGELSLARQAFDFFAGDENAFLASSSPLAKFLIPIFLDRSVCNTMDIRILFNQEGQPFYIDVPQLLLMSRDLGAARLSELLQEVWYMYRQVSPNAAILFRKKQFVFFLNVPGMGFLVKVFCKDYFSPCPNFFANVIDIKKSSAISNFRKTEYSRDYIRSIELLGQVSPNGEVFLDSAAVNSIVQRYGFDQTMSLVFWAMKMAFDAMEKISKETVFGRMSYLFHDLFEMLKQTF